MPRIINAYDENSGSGIAAQLAKVGDDMFGNGARDENYRQSARKLGRQNDARPREADAFRRGDYREMGAEAIVGDGEAHAPAMGLYGAGLDANGNINDPRLNTAAIGAGHSAESTVWGEKSNLAQRAAAAHEATTRAMATQEAIADRQLAADRFKNEHDPMAVYDEQGVGKYVPKSQAFDTGNRPAPLHKDQVVGGILQRATQPPVQPAQPLSFAAPPAAQPGVQPPVAAPGVAPAVPQPAAPMARPVSPFAGLDNDTRHLAGLQTPTPEQELQHGRDAAQMKAVAARQLPPEPTARSAAQADVENTAGPYALLKKVATEIPGAVFGTNLIPGQTAAEQNAKMRSQRTATTMAASSALPPGIRALGTEARNIPGPGTFGNSGINSEAEGQNAVLFARNVRTQWQQLKAYASRPDITAPDREKAGKHMLALEDVIKDWESPAQGAHPAAAAPGNAQPPQGFKQAPDGKFYSTQKGPNGKYQEWTP